MSDVSQVVAQMVAAGMPALPANHPVLDGTYKRFGKGKKAWYILREMTLQSGRTVVTGAFGIFQGEERNTVPVTIDFTDLTEEDRAEFARKQKQHDTREADDKKRAGELAANRARDQWSKAADIPVHHPYLERKQITPEGVRVSVDGMLLIPFTRDGKLIGVQKIDQAGEKRFNKGMEKPGAALVLGQLAGADVIGVGEGYATCRTVRMLPSSLANAFPVVTAIDAGNIMPVALRLRAHCPEAHLLFLADDDYMLEHRFIERLREDFRVSTAVPIDGETHSVVADDGEMASVMAAWRTDAQGVAYIQADIRKGRMLRTPTYKNAGVASCRAAAAAVGNASVVLPVFANRAGRKLTDFNDLAVDESLDVVEAQIGSALLAAKQPKLALPALSAAPAATPASLADLGQGAGSADSPRPPDAECGTVEGCPAVGAAGDLPAVCQPVETAFTVPVAAQGQSAGAADFPHPPDVECGAVEGRPTLAAAAVPSETTGVVSLEWAISHCALVQGKTDVWDGLNRLYMKRAAFVDMVGKESAKAWAVHPERRTISPRALPATKRGVASENGGLGGDNIVMMLDRYTLLYGTKTVFDAEKKSIIGYDAMALARGNDLASRWISHPLHMEKDYDKVVFDPTQRVDLNTHINLFEGFPLTPRTDEAKASMALDLLWSLCMAEANGEEVYRWVLAWLAYPLQHPGAKMQTGLLFFGEKQGTGKSLFFEGIVKPIYGAHGATGGQHQLEGAYTMWRSQKLFVLFEEILSRQDKYSYFGLIKHMITGRDTPISQKFKDDRVEANHMNCVMLSNEFQAIPLEPEDRRFLVVDVRQPLHPDVLAKVKAALNDGLIEAFYAFLLAYPLGDFNEHTKPVMTPAKERVINFGRPDWETFYLSWSAGELGAPYCSCLSTDLYIMYSRYASRYGLRSMSMTKLNEMIGQRLKKDRQWVALGPGAEKKKLLSVFHVPYVPPTEDSPGSGRQGTLSEQCLVFRDLADIRTEV